MKVQYLIRFTKTHGNVGNHRSYSHCIGTLFGAHLFIIRRILLLFPSNIHDNIHNHQVIIIQYMTCPLVHDCPSAVTSYQQRHLKTQDIASLTYSNSLKAESIRYISLILRQEKCSIVITATRLQRLPQVTAWRNRKMRKASPCQENRAFAGENTPVTIAVV